MRSIQLILTLGVTSVIGVPIQPRDFLDDFGSGGEFFGGLGNSIDDGGDFTASIGGGSLDSFNIADASFSGGDFGLAGISGIESLDLLPTIDNTALVPQENLYVEEPQPQIVADVLPTDPGLGAVNGDLIAVAPTTPDTNQIPPKSGVTISFDNNEPIPEFTPSSDSVVATLDLDPTKFGSSSDPNPVPIAVNPDPPAPVTPDPGTPPANPDGLSIAGFIAPPVDLGADTALTPNLDVINAPIAFTPDDTNVAATLPDLSVPPVQVASTEGSIGTGEKLPSLQQFKDTANQLANDPKLKPEERQTWKDFGEVANSLTPEDFGKITLNEQFTTPGKVAGTTGDTVGDLTPKAQTVIRTSNPTNAYRRPSAFDSILTSAGSGVAQALIRLGSIFGERAILNPQQQIYTLVQKVGVPVSVAVPVTLKVGVAVPVTLYSTLPGGVVTKILVYRPNPAKTTSVANVANKPSSTGKPVVVAAKPTNPPQPKPAKAKRDAEESSHADTPKEVQADPEHDVLVPQAHPDPEYYVEPEPKEWENSHGKEVVISPVEVPKHWQETEKPQWDKIDSTFKYQAGDYGPWEYSRPPPSGTSDEPWNPKEEPWHPKGSGGGAVEEEKPTA